jgi:lysophospholipid acyltransferase (LPLAT)-like uncharacterized protein
VKIQSPLVSSLISFLGYGIVRVIALTCRFRFEVASNLPSTPAIIAFWHGELLMQPFLYQKCRKAHKVAAMISDHGDGELIAKLIEYFGFSTVRGSSRKGAVKVLAAALKAIDKGYDLAITPDGPKGPRFSIADGIVVISQKKDIPIISFSYTPSAYWQLGSWDKFLIPRPFSTIVYRASEPFYLTGMSMEEAKQEVSQRIVCGVC